MCLRALTARNAFLADSSTRAVDFLQSLGSTGRSFEETYPLPSGEAPHEEPSRGAFLFSRSSTACASLTSYAHILLGDSILYIMRDQYGAMISLFTDGGSPRTSRLGVSRPLLKTKKPGILKASKNAAVQFKRRSSVSSSSSSSSSSQEEETEPTELLGDPFSGIDTAPGCKRDILHNDQIILEKGCPLLEHLLRHFDTCRQYAAWSDWEEAK